MAEHLTLPRVDVYIILRVNKWDFAVIDLENPGIFINEKSPPRSQEPGYVTRGD